ncbi:MAG: hypothetical protein AAGC47_03175 [Bacteroidota bacterium]
MKHETIAVAGVSFLLLVYTMFATMEVFLGFVYLIFAISPVLIIWMVWVVLKNGEYHGEELIEDQEFGYEDKPDIGKPAEVRVQNKAK